MTSPQGSLIKVFILFTVLSAMVLDARAQDQSMRFQHLTSEDGLPQNMVDCILQDHLGFMWFGTWNGLCRYDGYTFEKFEALPDQEFSSNFIYSLFEDRFGNIWVGTNKGLYIYLYDKGIMTRPLIDTSDSTFLKGTINHIQQVNDRVWISTEKGIFEIESLSNQGNLHVHSRRFFGTGPNELPATIVRDFLWLEEHTWMATDRGLYVLKNDGSLQSFRSIPSDPESISSDIITSLFYSNQTGLWVGTEIGLNHFRKGQFRRYYHNPLDGKSLVHNTVMDIQEDPSGALLVATLGGLSILRPNSSEFTNYQNQQNRQHSLNNNFINCLFLDNQKNLWIGTERGGVNFLSANQNTFEHFEHELGNPNSLSNSTVNAIFEDEKYIWIGTAGGGLNRFNKQKGTFTHYLNDPERSGSISSNFVTNVFRDTKGQLWVSTWGFGLNKLLDEGSKQERFEHYQNDLYPGMSSNFISSMVEDHQGRFWIGTLNGLVLFDPTTRSFRIVTDENNAQQITGVGCLAFESTSVLWVGTQTGLFKVKVSGDSYQISDFRYDPKKEQSLSGNYVISAYKDREGTMWFGTYGQGVNRLVANEDDFFFDHFSMAEGLGNGIIYGILQDGDGKMWLSTDYGLVWLDPKTRNVRNFYINDGLLNNQYYWSAAYKNQSGKLYFGGMDGLDTFFPDWIKDRSIENKVIITDIKLLNESVIPGKEYNGVEALSESVSKSSELHLSYKEKIVAIEFSSFNYQEPNQIQYAYKLEGFDVKWNYVNAERRFANYTNLKPGSYVFKVKLVDVSPEEVVTILNIQINPPFWETTWFRVLVVFILIGAIMGYIRLRTLTLKKQKLVLERQVAERTERINQQNEALSYQAVQLQKSNQALEQKQEQIEGQNHTLEVQNKEILSQRDELIYLNNKLNTVNQLKLSFFTNISHEFRTPLTLIIGPIERMLKDRAHSSETQGSLSIIHRNAQRLLHLVNQIMDFRKIEQGRMELNIRKGDLTLFCRNIFEAFQPLAEIKKIDFKMEVDELPKDAWFDHQVIENILYNLLSNAFKYTPDSGKICMSLASLTVGDSKLSPMKHMELEGRSVISIKVADSGIGISEENLPLVFKRFYRINSEESLKISGSGIGLALTEELIKTHHGEILVKSLLGQGSEFEIQFPCMSRSFPEKEVPASNHDHNTIKQQIEVLTQEFVLDKSEPNLSDLTFDKSRSTVLVVEDNLDLRTFITHRLNKIYNVCEAGNGVDGLKLARKIDPDLVISDIMMPKMDGLELCASIKNNLDTSHIPVILLTAKGSVENQLEGLHIGADDYLPKPFNFEILEARVYNQIETRNRLRKQFLTNAAVQVEELVSGTRDQKFLELAIRTVEDHMENSDFGVGMFVEEMGISRSLLHKKLSALTGQSAADFINHIRLKKAASLLKDSDLNISQVAYSVGYSDPKYFTRLFHKQFGLSPKDFITSDQTVSK